MITLIAFFVGLVIGGYIGYSVGAGLASTDIAIAEREIKILKTRLENLMKPGVTATGPQGGLAPTPKS